jgi:hypothetical protein
MNLLKLLNEIIIRWKGKRNDRKMCYHIPRSYERVCDSIKATLLQVRWLNSSNYMIKNISFQEKDVELYLWGARNVGSKSSFNQKIDLNLCFFWYNSNKLS